MKGKLSVLIKNKENDIEIKKFIFKIKSFAKNTNIEENEKLSSVDDTFAGKSLDDSSESFDNTFLCKNSTADSNDKIHSDKASEEAYENICSNGGVSEGCENKYSYNNENSCGDGVHETYEEIYSYSDRNNAYFDDRDFDRDIKLIIEGLELNPEIDVSLEEDVDDILENADTRFDTGENFEEAVRQVFRSMRAENDTDEEDIDSIIESVNQREESESEEFFDMIDINEDLDMLLADIRSYNKYDLEQETEQKKTSRPTKRVKIYYEDELIPQRKIKDGESNRNSGDTENRKKDSNEDSEERPRRISSELLRKMLFALITVAAVTVLLTMLFMPVLQIYGTSMSPLLEEGDVLLTFRTYDFNRGDIISFYYNNKILVKRVIAFEGDFVNIKNDGSVYVNNKKLQEEYVSEKALGECDITLPYQVPSGKIFVLGDHRLTSVDSRNKAMGCVSLEQISGKPVFRVWPLNRMGFVEN